MTTPAPLEVGMDKLRAARPIKERSRPTPGAIVWLLTGVGLLLMHAPLITVIFLSLRDQGSWSFRWYRDLAGNGSILEALGVSLSVAVFSTVISATFRS